VLAALALMLAFALLLLPRLVRSNLAANEAAAIAISKEISQAELTYAATYPAIGFAASIDHLSGRGDGCLSRPERACLLAPDIADRPHSSHGYTFSAESSGTPIKTTFFSLATPLQIGETGQLSFCTTNRWVIHYRGDGRPFPDGETCEASSILR
jgi:hypothetical protein